MLNLFQPPCITKIYAFARRDAHVCMARFARFTRYVSSGPELLLRDPPVELHSWPGLRSATLGALQRGQLDAQLWWRYGALARRKLLEEGLDSEGDATQVVLHCARAGVTGGVYSAYVKAIGSGSGKGVAPAVCELSRLGLLPLQKRLVKGIILEIILELLGMEIG